MAISMCCCSAVRAEAWQRVYSCRACTTCCSLGETSLTASSTDHTGLLLREASSESLWVATCTESVFEWTVLFLMLTACGGHRLERV